MPPLAGQAVQIGAAVRLPRAAPVRFSVRLKLLQCLAIVSQRMGRQSALVGQMPVKGGRPGIGRFAGFGFQAAALARALAVLADLGLRGSRGGKSKQTFPSFHMRNAEKGRRVLLEINFSSRAVFPFCSRS